MKMNKRIKAHLRWLTEIESFIVTDKMMFALDNGLIYQLGRDFHYFPIVILNLSKLNAVFENKKALLDATLYLLILVREVMCLPYHVERWNMLIDCSSIAYAHGQLNFLTDLQDLIRTNFPKTVERIFMFNCKVTEELGKKFRPFPPGADSKRQVFIQNKFDITLFKYISPEQLEKRFGGTIDDIQGDFYPPMSTAFIRTGLPAESIKARNLFYFTMTPIDIFSNIIVQQTSPTAYPLKTKQEPRFIERPAYKCSIG